MPPVGGRREIFNIRGFKEYPYVIDSCYYISFQRVYVPPFSFQHKDASLHILNTLMALKIHLMA